LTRDPDDTEKAGSNSRLFYYKNIAAYSLWRVHVFVMDETNVPRHAGLDPASIAARLRGARVSSCSRMVDPGWIRHDPSGEFSPLHQTPQSNNLLNLAQMLLRQGVGVSFLSTIHIH
jgi:hypothetical protein